MFTSLRPGREGFCITELGTARGAEALGVGSASYLEADDHGFTSMIFFGDVLFALFSLLFRFCQGFLFQPTLSFFCFDFVPLRLLISLSVVSVSPRILWHVLLTAGEKSLMCAAFWRQQYKMCCCCSLLKLVGQGEEKWCRSIDQIVKDAKASKTHSAGSDSALCRHFFEGYARDLSQGRGTFYTDVGDSLTSVDHALKLQCLGRRNSIDLWRRSNLRYSSPLGKENETKWPTTSNIYTMTDLLALLLQVAFHSVPPEGLLLGSLAISATKSHEEDAEQAMLVVLTWTSSRWRPFVTLYLFLNNLHCVFVLNDNLDMMAKSRV